MKNNQSLIRLMVEVCLIGFILSFCLCFLYMLERRNNRVNEPVLYLFNILSGLVGGIFAFAFGLPSPSSSEGLDRSCPKST
jgi:uncharacterized membrane protein YsdA (DUF1294 family)